jgi:hypothetical protein
LPAPATLIVAYTASSRAHDFVDARLRLADRREDDFGVGRFDRRDVIFVDDSAELVQNDVCPALSSLHTLRGAP